MASPLAASDGAEPELALVQVEDHHGAEAGAGPVGEHALAVGGEVLLHGRQGDPLAAVLRPPQEGAQGGRVQREHPPLRRLEAAVVLEQVDGRVHQ